MVHFPKSHAARDAAPPGPGQSSMWTPTPNDVLRYSWNARAEPAGPWLARASSPSPGRRLARDADPLGPGETGTGCLSKHVVPWYRSHALRRDQPALGQRIASGMFEPVALGTVAQQATQPRSGPGQPDNVGSYAHDVISFPVECVQAPTCWPLASRTGLPRLIQPPQYRELSRKRLNLDRCGSSRPTTRTHESAMYSGTACMHGP